MEAFAGVLDMSNDNVAASSYGQIQTYSDLNFDNFVRGCIDRGAVRVRMVLALVCLWLTRA